MLRNEDGTGIDDDMGRDITKDEKRELWFSIDQRIDEIKEDPNETFTSFNNKHMGINGSSFLESPQVQDSQCGMVLTLIIFIFVVEKLDQNCDKYDGTEWVEEPQIARLDTEESKSTVKNPSMSFRQNKESSENQIKLMFETSPMLSSPDFDKGAMRAIACLISPNTPRSGFDKVVSPRHWEFGMLKTIIYSLFNLDVSKSDESKPSEDPQLSHEESEISSIEKNSAKNIEISGSKKSSWSSQNTSMKQFQTKVSSMLFKIVNKVMSNGKFLNVFS